MPVGFTRSLADRLNGLTPFEVAEAAPGDQLMVGRALVAPGGFHMTVEEGDQIGLNQNPTVHGVRPAVDVTMVSAVKRYGGSLLGVILTGMGRDGANGAMLIHQAGGLVIAEAEETSVVWGMPRSVIEAGAADIVVPLDRIPSTIAREIKGRKRGR